MQCTARPHMASKGFRGHPTVRFVSEKGASCRYKNYRLLANDINFHRIFTLGVASTDLHVNTCKRRKAKNTRIKDLDFGLPPTSDSWRPSGYEGGAKRSSLKQRTNLSMNGQPAAHSYSGFEKLYLQSYTSELVAVFTVG